MALFPFRWFRRADRARESVTLDDGRIVTLLPVTPDAKPIIARAMERVSPESSRRRFFTVRRRFSERELDQMTTLDGWNRYAIGAVADGPDGPLGAAVARFARVANDPRAAEVALLVVDDFQHVGLGRRLLARIADAARSRGIERLTGTVLARQRCDARPAPRPCPGPRARTRRRAPRDRGPADRHALARRARGGVTGPRRTIRLSAPRPPDDRDPADPHRRRDQQPLHDRAAVRARRRPRRRARARAPARRRGSHRRRPHRPRDARRRARLVRRRIADAVRPLATPEARRHAYEIAVAVAAADGVHSPAEGAFLRDLASALGLPADAARRSSREPTPIAAAPAVATRPPLRRRPGPAT